MKKDKKDKNFGLGVDCSFETIRPRKNESISTLDKVLWAKWNPNFYWSHFYYYILFVCLQLEPLRARQKWHPNL